MRDELQAALKQTGRLQNEARATRRALRQLEDALPRELGSYRLTAREQLDPGDLIAFLALALDGHDGPVVITVHSPRAGTDKGAHDERSNRVASGSNGYQAVGVRPGDG